MDLNCKKVNLLVGRWKVIWRSRTPEQQIQEQQVGESSGCEQGYSKMGTSGHLWCILGDIKRAGLCQARKTKWRSPSFLIIPMPRAFMECEMSKDKCKVQENISSMRNWAVAFGESQGAFELVKG